MDDVENHDRKYREVIDRLVQGCHDGQGQIAAGKARAGVWNVNADAEPERWPDQWAMNRLLERLGRAEREVLAQMLAEAFVGGVFEALVVLHEEQVAPLGAGYEGTPYHDFVGRLDGWTWPPPDRARW